jgi:hypothetical protein
MDWKRVAKNRIRCGEYDVVRETLWDEVIYMAEHKGELLTVCYDADTAKAVCMRDQNNNHTMHCRRLSHG